MSLRVETEYYSMDEFPWRAKVVDAYLGELSAKQKEVIWNHIEEAFSEMETITTSQINDYVMYEFDSICYSCFGVDYETFTEFATHCDDFEEAIQELIIPEVKDTIIREIDGKVEKFDSEYIKNFLSEDFRQPINIEAYKPETEDDEFYLCVEIVFSDIHKLEMEVYGKDYDELLDNFFNY